MFADRLGHVLVLTGMQGVKPAHDPLKRGHLHHHLGHQVRLAKHGRPQGGFFFLSLQAQRFSQLVHQPLDPAAFIQHRTQLHLEGERGEARQEILELVLKILFNEEISVGEPGSDDLRVPVCHGIQMLFITVAHPHEIRQQAAIRFTDGEIALVLFHHRNQHLRRQAQKIGVEFPQEGARCFHQVSDFFEDRLRKNRLTTRLSHHFLHLPLDRLPPGLRIKDDTLGFQNLAVLGGASNFYLRGGIQPQPAGGAAGCQPGKLEGNNLPASQRQQPAYRARKDSVGAVPPDGLIEFDPADQHRQRFLKDLCSRKTVLLDDRRHVAAVIHLPYFQLFHRDALAAGEPFRRRGGLALRVKCARRGRTLHHQGSILLAGRHFLHHHHQPPRGAHHRNIPVLQTQIIQYCRDAFPQLGERGIQIGNRQLFCADFEQEVHILLGWFDGGEHFGRSFGFNLLRFCKPGETKRLALLDIRFRNSA